MLQAESPKIPTDPAGKSYTGKRNKTKKTTVNKYDNYIVKYVLILMHRTGNGLKSNTQIK